MKRYMALLKDMESAGYMTEDPEGDWVRYEDAALLLRERDEARALAATEARVAADWRESDEVCQRRNEKLVRANSELESALSRESEELGEEYAKRVAAEAEVTRLMSRVTRAFSYIAELGVDEPIRIDLERILRG